MQAVDWAAFGSESDGLASEHSAERLERLCTPDLLPSDITGFNIFNQKSHEFEFHQGPVSANVLLADEINRATPRTQSALLESMVAITR